MKRIAIDAGHYLYTSGKRCKKSLDPEETREWVLNSRIASMLVTRLAEYEDCEVMRVDDVTGETEIGLAARCQKANDWKADVYISIHHNAGIYGGSGGGTVAFWYSSNSEREKQCKALYDAVVAETGLVGNRSNKVVYKNYYVLRNTNMPAFLLENGFMDSSTDVPIILSYEHAEKTAIGLEKFLANMLDLHKPEPMPEPEPEPKPEPAPMPEPPVEAPDVDSFGMDRYNRIEQVPKWARATIRKVIKLGILQGDGSGLNLSLDMIRMFVYNDRAGLYKE